MKKHTSTGPDQMCGIEKMEEPEMIQAAAVPLSILHMHMLKSEFNHTDTGVLAKMLQRSNRSRTWITYKLTWVRQRSLRDLSK
jgi:hypothetical protein